MVFQAPNAQKNPVDGGAQPYALPAGGTKGAALPPPRWSLRDRERAAYDRREYPSVEDVAFPERHGDIAPLESRFVAAVASS